MEYLLQDLKHAFRLFRQSPGFTAAAVAALALGIGTNTAIFSVVNSVLLKPAAFPDPDRLVLFMNTSPQGSGPGASPAKFAHWRAQSGIVQDASAFRSGVANLTGTAYPERPAGYRNFYLLDSQVLSARSDDYEPVGFAHRIHDETTGGDCGACHHRYTTEGTDRVGMDLRELHATMDIKLGGPCSSCHDDMKKNPPQRCGRVAWMFPSPRTRVDTIAPTGDRALTIT